jgi:hypothetical protein
MTDITRTWEIDAGRFATVTLPHDATVEDVDSFKEYLALLRPEIELRWKLKRNNAHEATP